MLSTVIASIQDQADYKEILQTIHEEAATTKLISTEVGPSSGCCCPAVFIWMSLSCCSLTGWTIALTLADEIPLWAPDCPIIFFPEPNPLFYENAPWGVTTRRDRLLALITLANYQIPGSPKPEKAPIIIAPTRAVMSRTLPRRDFIKATRTIKIGQVIQPDSLIRSWVSKGYQAVNTVIAAGQFARRGGILDIWPADAEHPTRMEFFGDEIDTLRYFNPSTQRTLADYERLQIPPAREYLVKDWKNRS